MADRDNPLLPGERLFVTGYLRSGTTLVEKLLHQHPALSVGAQPAPLLYVHLMERFLGERGLRPHEYPLSHLFRETGYTRKEFDRYCGQCVITPAELHDVLDRQRSYSGWKTPELARSWAELQPGTLLDLFGQLGVQLARLHQRPAARILGAKEVLCEEFIPAFLQAGARVVLVLRDPRDVIASLNRGRGGEFGGAATPTLYVLRRWRLSVACALAHQDRPNFLLLRYEDLVRRLDQELGRLTDFLAVEPFGPRAFEGGLRDQSGGLWKGNSSFGEIELVDAGSIGSHRRVLGDECVRYVELLAGPEMKAMGYEPTVVGVRSAAAIVRAFKEPRPSTRANFAANYSTEPEQIVSELRRLEALTEELPVDEIPHWFLYHAAHERLRAASRRTDN